MDRALTGSPRRRASSSGPCTSCAGRCPRSRTASSPTRRSRAEIERFHAAVETREGAAAPACASAPSATPAPRRRRSSTCRSRCSTIATLLSRSSRYIRQNLGAEKAFDVVLHRVARSSFARHAPPMMRERVGDLTDVHIRVLSILLGLPDHDPVDVPEGRERDPRHARPDAEPHRAARSRRDRRDRDRCRHAHVARRDPRALARAARRRRTARRDDASRAAASTRCSTASTGTLVIESDGCRESRRSGTAREREARDEAELRAARDRRAGHDATACASCFARTSTCPRRPSSPRHSGAEGVGLMRTEFLVVGRATMPDEEEQYRAYRRVVEAFDGQPGRHPHVRHRRRQAARRRLSDRGEPVPRLARDPHVPRRAGAVQDAAARAAARGAARRRAHHAAARRHRRRGARGARAARRGRGGARRARRPVPRATCRSA